MEKRDTHFKVSGGTDGVIWCVAVKRTDGDVQVTGTKGENKVKVLTFSHGEWAAFIAGVKNGEFDI